MSLEGLNKTKAYRGSPQLLDLNLDLMNLNLKSM
jgi:hypothetical protein